MLKMGKEGKVTLRKEFCFAENMFWGGPQSCAKRTLESWSAKDDDILFILAVFTILVLFCEQPRLHSMV
jgi:hypothetical protein